MNDIKQMPKAFPSMELSFYLQSRGQISGKMFEGDFKFRIPNLKVKSQAEKLRCELNGGLDNILDASVSELHYMIAYLRFSMVEFPQWWEKSDYGYNLFDYNVIKEIFDKVEKFEKDYLVQMWGDDSKKEEESNGKAEPVKE